MFKSAKQETRMQKHFRNVFHRYRKLTGPSLPRIPMQDSACIERSSSRFRASLSLVRLGGGVDLRDICFPRSISTRETLHFDAGTKDTDQTLRTVFLIAMYEVRRGKIDHARASPENLQVLEAQMVDRSKAPIRLELSEMGTTRVHALNSI